MQNSFYGLLAAAALVTGTARGAEPSVAAQTRAGRYQQEVRAALTRHGWRVTEDQAGKLTAEHSWTPRNGATGFVLADQTQSTYARLQIGFRPEDKDHTTARANASLCIYESLSSPQVGFMTYPPLALRDPKLTQEYLDILAEADTHLTADQHAASESKQVAMK